jgi:lipoprotein-anchoring transpeptidase ErfK/SrfK
MEQGITNNEEFLGLIETEPQIKKKTWKRVLRILFIILIYLGFIPFLLFVVPRISEVFISANKSSWYSRAGEDPGRIKSLNSEIITLNKKIEKFTPGNAYLVVNTTENHFSLYRNRQLILVGVCSTGSYISLEGEGDKKWVFKTPKGDFKVRGKITDPVWRKPDWAFVEEGLPIPSANHPSRYERGVLGDYALAIGNGYLIHGTLYQRFLGLPVTHGCIRMNDADLKVVYNTLPVGAKVFIY